MPITIGKHGCTLGFFGYSQDHHRLAVTAGHCADRPDQLVYSNGVEIGIVVSHMPDAEDGNGRIGSGGSRGYTLIQIYREFAINRFFTSIANASKGDSIAKRGSTSKTTFGKIISTRNIPDRPDLGLIESNVVQLPGDSGGPWWTGDPAVLIGIGSSGNQATGGGDQPSQAQPIGSVIDLIRQQSPKWGIDFKVWI
ncbi:S1 family peptidase [Mycobacteroides abscessus]|uniref:S1 family peptidase n=1 Tax=Mycobacteroides abscessus TaxID=36809 RepID=UPI001F1F898F|nr:S1 family peptidase [Mycobacteroides abscessus]